MAENVSKTRWNHSHAPKIRYLVVTQWYLHKIIAGQAETPNISGILDAGAGDEAHNPQPTHRLGTL